MNLLSDQSAAYFNMELSVIKTIQPVCVCVRAYVCVYWHFNSAKRMFSYTVDPLTNNVNAESGVSPVSGPQAGEWHRTPRVQLEH